MSEDISIEKLNPHFRWDWRKSKKHVRNRYQALSRLGYYCDCNGMPAKITDLYYYSKFCGGEVDGESMVPGKHATSCSLFNCAPQAISKEEAEERARFYIENGQMAYLKRYLYKVETPEQENELREWYRSWGWLDEKNP